MLSRPTFFHQQKSENLGWIIVGIGIYLHIESDMTTSTLQVPLQRSLSESGEWAAIGDTENPDVNPDLYKSGLTIENCLKNRWGNIIALEKTRVHLDGRTPDTDYINANYIDVGDGEEFIACQAPLPNTFDDFWWMVWTHKAPVIGMFTRLFEKSRVKAHIYWPTDLGKTVSFLGGSLGVTNLGFETDGSFRITSLKLTYGSGEDEETHTLKHYHYTGWPDFGIPEDTGDVLRFFDNLPVLRGKSASPVVLHCSAGCGRVGAVCAIYRKLKTGEDVPKVVETLRGCRQGMVQTKDQYKFIYRMVREMEKMLRTKLSSKPTDEVSPDGYTMDEDGHVLIQINLPEIPSPADDMKDLTASVAAWRTASGLTRDGKAVTFDNGIEVVIDDEGAGDKPEGFTFGGSITPDVVSPVTPPASPCLTEPPAEPPTEPPVVYRRKGEKAKAWPQDELSLTEIKHGDIIYDPDGYRGTETKVVRNVHPGQSITLGTCDGSGYCEIPQEVSRHIEDPVDFYSEIIDDKLYQGVSRVILDPVGNQILLQSLTGGRPVHFSRTVCWESMEEAVLIHTPPSPDCPRGDYAVLDDKTPDEYLGDAEELPSDPLVARERDAISLRHTLIEDSIWKCLRNDHLSVRDLPTSVDGGCSGASLKFKGFTKDEDHVVTEVLCEEHNGTPVVFTLQRCPLEHGPYAKLDLWTADNPVGHPRKFILTLVSYD